MFLVPNLIQKQSQFVDPVLDCTSELVNSGVPKNRFETCCKGLLKPTVLIKIIKALSLEDKKASLTSFSSTILFSQLLNFNSLKNIDLNKNSH